MPEFALVSEICFDQRWKIKLIVGAISLFWEDYFGESSRSCGYKLSI